MSENRFLQSFCAVAASSVLVCGTLLLLTSTAPWTPPEIGESSTPDAARDMAETMPPLEIDVAEETVAALGSPLNAETADAGSDVGADDAENAATIAEPTLPVGTDLSVTFSSPAPAGERTEAATDQIAGLAELPPRVIASDMSESATEEVAALAAELPPAPPPVIASEKTEAAAEQVAGLAADLLPAPQPLTARAMAETVPEVTAQVASTADTVIGESQVAETEFVDVSAAITAMPAAYVVAEQETGPFKLAAAGEPPVAELFAAEPAAAKSLAPAKTMDAVERDPPELAVVELAPPPMPHRKPEMAAAPSVAELPAPEAVETPPVKTATSTPAREKPAAPAQELPKQAAAQTGRGLFGLLKPMTPGKPMALAPADQPAAPSKPATARPSSGAYASQVWSRLARHKPRAGQRGSASVSFTIGEMGALRGAQIARSSGNARIDQLALQTVRGAAPFPAPPTGAVSYTIRIDFQ